jgi:uncharacterized protein YrrD
METTYLSHELHGRPVISTVDGSVIAKVEDVLIDPKALRVAAVLVYRGPLLRRETKTILSDRIQVWGEDAILMRGAQEGFSEGDLPADEGWLRVMNDIKGHDVLADDGRRIGALSDVLLNTEGQVVAYDLARVFDEEAFPDAMRIPASATQSLGRDVLIVHLPEREEQV